MIRKKSALTRLNLGNESPLVSGRCQDDFALDDALIRVCLLRPLSSSIVCTRQRCVCVSVCEEISNRTPDRQTIEHETDRRTAKYEYSTSTVRVPIDL